MLVLGGCCGGSVLYLISWFSVASILVMCCVYLGYVLRLSWFCVASISVRCCVFSLGPVVGLFSVVAQSLLPNLFSSPSRHHREPFLSLTCLPNMSLQWPRPQLVPDLFVVSAQSLKLHLVFPFSTPLSTSLRFPFSPFHIADSRPRQHTDFYAPSHCTDSTSDDRF